MDSIKEMNNHSIKMVWRELYARYEKLSRGIDKELKNLPKENLHIVKSKGRLIFREYMPRTKNKYVKTINSQPEKIELLCRKYRLEQQHKAMIKMAELIREIHSLQKYEFIEDAIKMMRGHFQELPIEMFDPKYKEATNWQKKNHQDIDFRRDELEYISESGVRVRSKSELIIVGELEKYDVPFVYEKQLNVGWIDFHPDFTIMRKFDNKIFYWEHCGLDTDDYRKRHKYKIMQYKDVGIIEGENLIVTDEEDISKRRIGSIIIEKLM